MMTKPSDATAMTRQIDFETNVFALPQVISELLQLTSGDNYSADTLAKLILKDPSLTAKVLKLSNSSFYARGTRSKTVNQAISVVGMNMVRCLALSASVLNPERIKAKSGVDTKDLFTYILSVAAAAEMLSKPAGLVHTEEALIAGLLHDIGIIYFLDRYPEEYRAVKVLQSRGFTICDAEKKVFGVDHCEIGARLAKSWGLSEDTVSAIAGHHDIRNLESGASLGGIAKLAVLLIFDSYSNFNGVIEERLQQIDRVTKALGMNSEVVSDIKKNLNARVTEIAETIGVEIIESEQLLAKANQEIWKSYLEIERLFKQRDNLNEQLLSQERNNAAVEAKNSALATLSHYLNNAVMIISGQAQLLLMLQKSNSCEKLMEQVPVSAENINQAVKKILAVMQEMKEISPLDQQEYFNKSIAMNIDARIEARMKTALM
jgi:two-component system, cell cycle response regulator